MECDLTTLDKLVYNIYHGMLNLGCISENGHIIFCDKEQESAVQSASGFFVWCEVNNDVVPARIFTLVKPYCLGSFNLLSIWRESAPSG
jgi:hypothetical protein